MEIYTDAISQYIDSNGKTRMLGYPNGVSVMTPPIPPLSVPIDREIHSAKIKSVLGFIKRYNLKIDLQDGDSSVGKIQGLWVSSKNNRNSTLKYAYIPVRHSNALKGVEFVPYTLNDPLRTDEVSDLKSMFLIRRTADYLKQYTLYEYSLDPEGFSKNSFEIIKGHTYNISKLNKRLFKKNNDVMYTSDGKIIVPSESVRDRLLRFLERALLNDTPGVLEYRNRDVIKDYYRTLNDFRKSESSLVFLSKDSLKRWKRDVAKIKDTREVHTTLKESDYEEGYFYKNYNINNGKIVIIQNTRSKTMEDAVKIAKKWAKDRVNVGYSARTFEIPEKVVCDVFREDGNHIIPENPSRLQRVSIIEYSTGGYASVLPF